MANYGTILRPAAAVSSRIAKEIPDRVRPAAKAVAKLAPHVNCFGFPTDTEAAAVRVVRNLSYFRFYYALFLWIVLAISLIPQRRISLLFLVLISMAYLAFQLMPHVVPSTAVAHRYVNRHLVAAVVVIMIIVQLVLTRALKHLLITQGICIPIILVHALFRITDDLFVSQDAMAAGELVPLMDIKEKDMETASQ